MTDPLPTEMCALVCEATADDLSGVTIGALPVPRPGPGEVLVKVRAASLNYPDVLICQGRYQLKPDLPFVPGMDLAGDVAGAQLGPPFQALVDVGLDEAKAHVRNGRAFEDGGKAWRKHTKRCQRLVRRCLRRLQAIERQGEKNPDMSVDPKAIKRLQTDLERFAAKLEAQKWAKRLPR